MFPSDVRDCLSRRHAMFPNDVRDCLSRCHAMFPSDVRDCLYRRHVRGFCFLLFLSHVQLCRCFAFSRRGQAIPIVS